MQTSIGVIYENENEANGMNKILKQLHEFVPFVDDGEEREYYHQAVVGGPAHSRTCCQCTHYIM